MVQELILDDKNHSYKKTIGQTSLVVPNLSNEMKFTQANKVKKCLP